MKLYEANQRGYKHKNLIFWIAMINSLSRPLDKEDIVLDLGCGSGLFLQLLFECSQYGRGVGIDFDSSAIAQANQYLQQRNRIPVSYIQTTPSGLLNTHPELRFDVIFCQEIFWMNEDLAPLSDTLFSLLKTGGRCYCTIGCHAENPTWVARQKKIHSEGIKSFSHRLDDIAHTFSKAGFAVGLRRLPLDGFMMFHPQATELNSGSFEKLVSSTYENKMLFYFGKEEEVVGPKNIYD